MNFSHYYFSRDVADALQSNSPVLAMESTILTHGLPYPENRQFLEKATEIVRSFDVTPATIAVINGAICIGLSDPDKKVLFSPKGPRIKISLRDLGSSLSTKASGGTTVSATLHIAHSVGLPVFATGGIGGVHRGAEYSFDVSQDLLALSKYPIATISAGAKAVLDIGKTRELLETLSVPIVGYKSARFPSFYFRGGGGKLSWRADTVEELSSFLSHHFDMKTGGGVLVANPPPKECVISADLIEKVVASAVEKARKKRVFGKEITPFLLDEIKTETGGESVKTNVALALNNIQLGARLAVALNKA